jgi:aminoglycoside 6'-N-acetyltransferase I
MNIVDLNPADTTMLEQAARLLVDGFQEHSPSWIDMVSAREEVIKALEPGKIRRAAVDDAGNVLGWVGGISQYGGHVWELHPLVVDPRYQRQGIGRALVVDFEARVRERGGLTILLGSDDEDDRTTLSGVDLYDDTWQRIASVRNLRGHPYEFYQKLGFTIVGVVPDANGPGKPDIILAKRVAQMSDLSDKSDI